MISHPIYNKSENPIHRLVNCLNNSDKLKKELNMLQLVIGKSIGDEAMASLLCKAVIFKEIINNNHNLIKINKDEWSSDITKKTLEKLKITDFNFAFKSGAVVYDKYNIFFTYLTGKEIQEKYKHISSIVGSKNNPDKGFLHIIFTANDDVNTNVYYAISDKETIFSYDGADVNMTENQKDTISTLISVLSYAGMFKSIKDRVKETKIIGKKSSKQNIPKHTINQINLFQKISNEKEINGREGTKWKSEKRWLVRGHIRNQFYKSTGEYKIIFIDPFWKGDGIEEVEKVYNI